MISTDTPTSASLIVASSKNSLPDDLNATIALICREAIACHDAFTIALSGGSLPKFLTSLSQRFLDLNIDPQFDRWHVLLADERCVSEDDEDSNMGAIRKTFLSQVSIPKDQIHGIDTKYLNKQDSTNCIAKQYEITLRRVLEQHSNGFLDLAVLGFGPDGHTCSLFPDHDLLHETRLWVAPIEDSPKPPPRRITLTLPLLNQHTRHVIVCGAGEGKGRVLKQVFAHAVAVQSQQDDNNYSAETKQYTAVLRDPAPVPCGMVRPEARMEDCRTLTWIVDQDAFQAANLE
jgi:6-phosphogluconolactonase